MSKEVTQWLIDLGKEGKKWLDAIDKEGADWRESLNDGINDVRDAIDSIPDKVEEAVAAALKKLEAAGSYNLILQNAVPHSITYTAAIAGQAIICTWKDDEDIVTDVASMIKKEKFEYEHLYTYVPDEITVQIGLEFSFIVAFHKSARVTYTAKEDIKRTIDMFKELMS